MGDIAVKQCRKRTNDPNIKLLCDVYNTAYPTEGFQTADTPNIHLCFKIAEFAVMNIITQLPGEDIMTRSRFNDLARNENWDAAVHKCLEECENKDILILCDIYNSAYSLTDVRDSLCDKIRKFVLNNIRAKLPEEK